jgi:hypothetical protein
VVEQSWPALEQEPAGSEQVPPWLTQDAGGAQVPPRQIPLQRSPWSLCASIRALRPLASEEIVADTIKVAGSRKGSNPSRAATALRTASSSGQDWASAART